METTAIGAAAENPASSRAAIQQEDFLKVLLAQLQFQDPLEPLDNTEFIAQFAELTNLGQAQESNDKLDTLLSLQNSGQAIDLIGRSVEATTNTGSIIGEVSTVIFQNGVPSMTIRTDADEVITDVTLGQIRIVRQAVEFSTDG